MNKYALLLLGLMPILLFSQASRQYYHIPNAWMDVNVSGKLYKKFSWQIENSHRRQDMQGEYNESTTTGNLFHSFGQHVVRPYVHYQLSPKIRFSLMPLGWIGSNRFNEGNPISFFSELRISPQVMLTQFLGKLKLDNRLRYEMRWIGQNQPVDDKSFIYAGDFSSSTFRERLRYQLKLNLPFGREKISDKTLYGILSNEVFIQVGNQIPRANVLDQNRILIGLGYSVNRSLSVELAYQRQTIFRLNNTLKNNVDLNNILYVNMIVSNLNL